MTPEQIREAVVAQDDRYTSRRIVAHDRIVDAAALAYADLLERFESVELRDQIADIINYHDEDEPYPDLSADAAHRILTLLKEVAS